MCLALIGVSSPAHPGILATSPQGCRQPGLQIHSARVGVVRVQFSREPGLMPLQQTGFHPASPGRWVKWKCRQICSPALGGAEPTSWIPCGVLVPEHVANMSAGVPASAVSLSPGMPLAGLGPQGHGAGPGLEGLQSPAVVPSAWWDRDAAGGGPVSTPLGAAASLPRKAGAEGGGRCGLWPRREEEEPTHLTTPGKTGASPKSTLPAACVLGGKQGQTARVWTD